MDGSVRLQEKIILVSRALTAHRIFLIALQAIFRAANLILPDKAGKIINVGGWSDAALYGVRLPVSSSEKRMPMGKMRRAVHKLRVCLTLLSTLWPR
jgi:hypothetical protein